MSIQKKMLKSENVPSRLYHYYNCYHSITRFTSFLQTLSPHSLCFSVWIVSCWEEQLWKLLEKKTTRPTASVANACGSDTGCRPSCLSPLSASVVRQYLIRSVVMEAGRLWLPRRTVSRVWWESRAMPDSFYQTQDIDRLWRQSLSVVRQCLIVDQPF